MIWHSWKEFFAMGGYALYVWGSLGAVLLALAAELALLGARLRAARAAARLPAVRWRA